MPDKEHYREGLPLLHDGPILTAPNQEWAIDFASDVAASGRRLRIFSVVDCYTRECLTLEVDTSLPSRRVTRALAGIIETRGAPAAIRSDNGPEMSSRHYLAWCIEKRIDAVHIQPGKPTQNAHVESFPCAMNASTQVGSGICSTLGGRSVPGASNTTVRGRIPLSLTKRLRVCGQGRFAFWSVEYHTSGSASRLP